MSATVFVCVVVCVCLCFSPNQKHTAKQRRGDNIQGHCTMTRRGQKGAAFSQSLTHSLTHLLSYFLIQSFSQPVTQSLTQSVS